MWSRAGWILGGSRAPLGAHCALSLSLSFPHKTIPAAIHAATHAWKRVRRGERERGRERTRGEMRKREDTQEDNADGSPAGKSVSLFAQARKRGAHSKASIRPVEINTTARVVENAHDL